MGSACLRCGGHIFSFFSISGLIFLMRSVQSQIESEPEVGNVVPRWTIYLAYAKEGPSLGKNKTVTKIFL